MEGDAITKENVKPVFMWESVVTLQLLPLAGKFSSLTMNKTMGVVILDFKFMYFKKVSKKTTQSQTVSTKTIQIGIQEEHLT